MTKKNKNIVVGLSGGMDSAIALILLKEQGWQPIGVTLKLAVWKNRTNISIKNSEFQISLQRTRKLCAELNIEHKLLNYAHDFQTKIINSYITARQNRITPNPCIYCNKNLKFKTLFTFAQKHNITHIATGHYARIKKRRSQYQLLRALDKNKDQSYFLCLLNQKELSKIILPLGDKYYSRVKEMAKKYGIADLYNNRSSQDLCFVSSAQQQIFLEKEIGLQRGPIIDQHGKAIGQHRGLHFYTIGQRKGIRLGSGPWYVVGYDTQKNGLLVTDNFKDKRLYSKVVVIQKPNFISKIPYSNILSVQAKIRYNQHLKPAHLSIVSKNRAELTFSSRIKAPTRGQWAVYYQKETCLGGGIIIDYY